MSFAPSLLDDCMDAEGRATHGAVAERVGERRIKKSFNFFRNF
jgi:hypothetical protein